MQLTGLMSRANRYFRVRQAHRVGLPVALLPHIDGEERLSIVDVGAHAGSFTRAVDAIRRIECGVLIEAQSSLAAALRRSFVAPRFHVVHTAASDSIGSITLYQTRYDQASSILAPIPDLKYLENIPMDYTVGECPTRPLDAILAPYAFDRVSILKIDVQGAEHLVLSGARSTLKQTHAIWIEVSFERLYSGSCLFADVHAMLSSAGFGLREMQPAYRDQSGEMLQADALFVRRQ